MAKTKSTRARGNANWVKGVTQNPDGRPKGKYNETTIAFMSLKKLAAKHAPEAFNLLWRAMQANESWAHQIYFKELYGLPKNFDDKKVVIEDKSTDIDKQIQTLTEVLPEFEEVTHDETLSRLKVLTSMKTNEQIVDQVSQIRESRADLADKVEKFKAVIDHIETNGEEGHND